MRSQFCSASRSHAVAAARRSPRAIAAWYSRSRKRSGLKGIQCLSRAGRRESDKSEWDVVVFLAICEFFRRPRGPRHAAQHEANRVAPAELASDARPDRASALLEHVVVPGGVKVVVEIGLVGVIRRILERGSEAAQLVGEGGGDREFGEIDR